MSGGMEMPGGWTMSMMWMRMPGQSWPMAWAMFLAMWLAMMVAMMLPSALPTILIYRRVLRSRGQPNIGLALWLLGGGYFVVWLGFGVAAYVAGLAAASAAMHWSAISRAVPLISGAALIVCGVFQFTPWKVFCLAHCRDPLHYIASHLRPGIFGGLWLGLHHGAFCAACCWGLMVIQLTLGVMNLGVMAVVAIVITAEKLLPRAKAVIGVVGTASMVAGLYLIVRALITG